MPVSTPSARFSAHTERAGDPASTATFCYSVVAAAEPGVMPRVLELFAKRNLVPSRWHSIAAAEGDLQIDIQVEGLAPDVGDYIAACLRQIVNVETVLTGLKHGDTAAPPERLRRRA